MLKENMDMMMNSMKGWVSTNLDVLVHQTDSLFITQVTYFPFRVEDETKTR